MRFFLDVFPVLLREIDINLLSLSICAFANIRYAESSSSKDGTECHLSFSKDSNKVRSALSNLFFFMFTSSIYAHCLGWVFLQILHAGAGMLSARDVTDKIMCFRLFLLQLH